jgi:hypothetical protein
MNPNNTIKPVIIETPNKDQILEIARSKLFLRVLSPFSNMSDVDWIIIALTMLVAIQLNIPSTATEVKIEIKKLKKSLGEVEFGSSNVRFPKFVRTLNAPLIRPIIKKGITNSLILILYSRNEPLRISSKDNSLSGFLITKLYELDSVSF